MLLLPPTWWSSQLLLLRTCSFLELLAMDHPVGDSPRGPLKQLGNPHLKSATSRSKACLA
jgi:hypothetical protein